jgi:hypothetical protein
MLSYLVTGTEMENAYVLHVEHAMPVQFCYFMVNLCSARKGRKGKEQ